MKRLKLYNLKEEQRLQTGKPVFGRTIAVSIFPLQKKYSHNQIKFNVSNAKLSHYSRMSNFPTDQAVKFKNAHEKRFASGSFFSFAAL